MSSGLRRFTETRVSGSPVVPRQNERAIRNVLGGALFAGGRLGEEVPHTVARRDVAKAVVWPLQLLKCCDSASLSSISGWSRSRFDRSSLRAVRCTRSTVPLRWRVRGQIADSRIAFRRTTFRLLLHCRAYRTSPGLANSSDNASAMSTKRRLGLRPGANSN